MLCPGRGEGPVVQAEHPHAVELANLRGVNRGQSHDRARGLLEFLIVDRDRLQELDGGGTRLELSLHTTCRSASLR